MKAFNEYTERFLNVIEALGVSDYMLWNKLSNLSKATMSKIRCGKCGVSMNVLFEFCIEFENINADYIITGRGPMFKLETREESIHPNNIKILLEEYSKQTEKLLEIRDAKIRELEIENAILKAEKEIMNVG